jgi:hypothetical protein
MTRQPPGDRLGVMAVLILLTASHVPAAAAQSASTQPGRLELAAGLLWSGSQALGSHDASLTTGTGGTLRLFSSTTELLGSAGLEARVGVRVARAIDVEALASYATPQLLTRVSNDIENGTSVSIVESVQQYTVGAGVVWSLPSPRASARVRPFATAGAGYLRQLHEAATLVVTGRTYYVGGGAKLLLASRPRGRVRAAGVRFDARVLVRTSGITFDGRRSISPAIGASLFARF